MGPNACCALTPVPAADAAVTFCWTQAPADGPANWLAAPSKMTPLSAASEGVMDEAVLGGPQLMEIPSIRLELSPRLLVSENMHTPSSVVAS